MSNGVKPNQEHSEIESHLYQQAFQYFIEGLSNQQIQKNFQNFESRDVSHYILPSIDIIIEEIQSIIFSRKTYKHNTQYQQRKHKIEKELSGPKRFVFSGKQANQLGEENVKQFLRICRFYMQDGDLRRYNKNSIVKVYKCWFKNTREMSRNRVEGNNNARNGNERLQLTRKKRQMKLLQIEHDILLKKSQMLIIEGQIQLLQSNLQRKRQEISEENNQNAMEEQLSDCEEYQPKNTKTDKQIAQKQVTQQQKKGQRNHLKSVLKLPQNNRVKSGEQPAKKSLQAKKNGLVNDNNIKALTKQINKIRQKSKQRKDKDTQYKPTKEIKGKQQKAFKEIKIEANQPVDEWKFEQQKYYLKLLKQTASPKTQFQLQKRMMEKYGRIDKYRFDNLRKKKFAMYFNLRKSFLLQIKKRQVLSGKDYKQFVNHFQNLNNKTTFNFMIQFLHKYYGCKLADISEKSIKETIASVLELDVKILSEAYIKKNRLTELFVSQTSDKSIHVQPLKEKSPYKPKGLSSTNSKKTVKAVGAKGEIKQMDQGIKEQQMSVQEGGVKGGCVKVKERRATEQIQANKACSMVDNTRNE